MPKNKTIDLFFKRKERIDDEIQPSASILNSESNVENVLEQLMELPPKAIRIEEGKINIDTLVRNPGKCPQIWDYPINQQDEIRRVFMKFEPYQFIMDEYPLSGQEDHPRRFLKFFIG